MTLYILSPHRAGRPTAGDRESRQSPLPRDDSDEAGDGEAEERPSPGDGHLLPPETAAGAAPTAGGMTGVNHLVLTAVNHLVFLLNYLKKIYCVFLNVFYYYNYLLIDLTNLFWKLNLNCFT